MYYRCKIASLALIGVLLAGESIASDSPLKPPKVVVSGIAAKFELAAGAEDSTPYTIVVSRNGEQMFTRSGERPDVLEGVVLPSSGRYEIRVESAGETWTSSVRVLPAILTILPPLLAIAMALIFRQVVIALFAGVWLGAFFVLGYSPIRSLFYVVDHYVIDSLAGDSGSDHVSIAVFTLLLGGMVGVFSRIGGTSGVVQQISRIATTARRGQLATWLMGLAIFFDDYTNTLIVGNTMRPITDRLRISREKLSYIVDSTAAPVAVIAVITSWVGFEISLIKDAFESAGIDRNPFTTFVSSIQYSFYPLLTLFFVWLIAVTRRDFGPMRTAEIRAREEGLLLAKDAMPLSQIDQDITFDQTKDGRWHNAAIPILVVVLGTFVGLVITGRNSMLESGAAFSVMGAIRESNSFVALLWSSLAGCITAIILGLVQRLASLTDIMGAWVSGVKSMMAALIILVLAWCIGAVCSDLHTADYLVTKVSGVLQPAVLPTLIFLVAAAISFSTGTSWGTMTILTPIAIPLVVKIAEINTLGSGHFDAILLSSISAILAGSVFGDHCSPISDTTIMSSMASAADHIDHVRTQLPYALTVAVVAVLLGYLPSGYKVPSIISLLASAGVLFAIVRFVGKREREPVEEQ